MLAVGIDPGTARTGYGFIQAERGDFVAVAYGVITTQAGLSDVDRLESLYDELNLLLDTYKPELAAIEKLFFSRNVTSAISVSQARGVVLLGLQKRHIPIAEYTPMQVKQAVCGYGGADKMQIQNMIRTLLSLEANPKPDDAADALAIAYCHLQSQSILKYGDQQTRTVSW